MFLSNSILYPQDSYELLRTVNLHNLSANDYLNCLKTQAVALNPLTKKVYVTGILSNDASVIDLVTNKVVGSIPLPKDGFQLMSLFCDPELNRLFAYTQSSDGDQPTTLYAIDLSDNSVVDTYEFGEVVCAFIPDTIHHRIYCTFNNKTLISFNSMDFTDKSEITLAYKGVMGHIHSNGDTLYLASQNAGGQAKFSVYHLPDFHFEREMGLTHHSSLGEMGEVMVLSEDNKVIMSGLLTMEIGNLQGDSLAFFDWTGDYSTDESHGPEYDPVTKKLFVTQKAGYIFSG
jgi:YVTN family beta-propeller protein